MASKFKCFKCGAPLDYQNGKCGACGIEITRNELYQYHKTRIMLETGKSLSALEKISLALDLTEDFVQFCISKGATMELREALEQKGVTLIKI